MRLRDLIAGAAALAIFGSATPVAAEEPTTEQPAYDAVVEDGAFQLRDYAPMLVAEVSHNGQRSRALNAGFRRLAAYIFGRDRPAAEEGEGEREEIAMTSLVIQDPREEIAMTSPVLQDPAAEGVWRTRFVMPSKYTLGTLPQAPADISLVEVPARRMATVRFAGYSSSRNLATAEQALRDWMAQQGLTAVGPAEYAFYDSPMVPPPMRRSEVMIPVAN